MNIYEEILKTKNGSIPAALAILIKGTGSVPQRPGAKMLVFSDGFTIGTIGGGSLEDEVIREALRVLRDEKPTTLSIELNEEYGEHLCGGEVECFIDVIIPQPHLIILGAGHVGKSLTMVAAFAGFRVTIIDDRQDYANKERIPEGNEFVISDFSDPFKNMSVTERDCIVVATRGHRNDFSAIKAALMTKASYIGLLGSKTKKSVLMDRLVSDGFSKQSIGRIITPVGLPIDSKTPEEIAISIIAQIIQYRGKDK